MYKEMSIMASKRSDNENYVIIMKKIFKQYIELYRELKIKDWFLKAVRIFENILIYKTTNLNDEDKNMIKSFEEEFKSELSEGDDVIVSWKYRLISDQKNPNEEERITMKTFTRLNDKSRTIQGKRNILYKELSLIHI